MSEQEALTSSLPPMTYTREDNVDMWNTLTDIQKKQIFKTAQDRFPFLGMHFKYQNVKLSDTDFPKSALFGILMEIVGRKETRNIKQ